MNASFASVQLSCYAMGRGIDSQSNLSLGNATVHKTLKRFDLIPLSHYPEVLTCFVFFFLSTFFILQKVIINLL